MKKNILLYIIVFLSMIFSIVFFYIKNTITKNNNIVISVITQNKEILPENRIENVRKELNNNDIKGILEIPNTDYQTVVMQSNDNNYYLRKGVNRKYARGGTPFLDYRVNIDESKKILIYGHNSKYIEMPFKILENYYDKNYYNEHKYILLTSSKNTYKYEIFSVHIETGDWSYMKTDFKNDNEYFKNINMLKDRSMYDTGVEINKDDDVLILQTCSTKKEYQNYKKKYLIIVAKKVT